ncbi:hypothetical protein C8N32_1191 [Rhodovulum imhoffii]|uniref:Uncharacterized protein n=1 Tax=Rhodovulum imhoffii TaxID=365340 RepID=A0A2T5BPH2_9RHOB|nr:hypothetical protein [Rhodovulum imhoffii]MBK5932900.1 hypothetical protein [Rhodovulum imhoffii]PTN00944.1 hypothetical protein C8N32_1191 [Rhodovulum imhoffii]
MKNAVSAGVVYFVLVFGVGFLLGLVRFMIGGPLGTVGSAQALEIPILLVLCWVAAGWLVQKFDVPAKVTHRLVMGSVAFVLLLIAGLTVSVYGYGQGILGYLAAYATLWGGVGLALQFAVAFFPMIRA